MTSPNLYNWEPSTKRLESMRHLFTNDIPESFTPDEISWVLPKLGITDFEGSTEAIIKGHVVFNVARELHTLSSAHIQADLTPGSGISQQLDKLSKEIHEILSNTKKRVVVHCAMGMERSPLLVVWYLHKYRNLSISAAYKKVMKKRPIVLDRRHWINL